MPYSSKIFCRVWWLTCDSCSKPRLFKSHSGWWRAREYSRPCIKCASRASAKVRGDTQRGRGDGKTYTKQDGMHQHRRIMEQHLGRKLESWEHVHHKDEDKKNNDLSNLEVLTKSEHGRLHTTKRWESHAKSHDL